MPTAPSYAQRERLVKAWRRVAVRLSQKHPDWKRIDIARTIQRSPQGLRNGTALPYSLSYILAAFRGMTFPRNRPAKRPRRGRATRG